MEIRPYLRPTEPHRQSLSSALEPVVGPHYFRYFHGTLFLEADFSGTTDQAVQAVIDAAPVDSLALDAKFSADRLTLIERAAYLTLLDAINVERVREGVAAITPQQFITQVKAKADSLGG
jgi:hypothetical protein